MNSDSSFLAYNRLVTAELGSEDFWDYYTTSGTDTTDRVCRISHFATRSSQPVGQSALIGSFFFYYSSMQIKAPVHKVLLGCGAFSA
jgi:hypothetical protein